MTAKEAVNLLACRGVEYSFMGCYGVIFGCFVPLDQAAPGRAVFLKDRGSQIQRSIELLNEARPALVITTHRIASQLTEVGSTIAVENPRLAFAVIAGAMYGDKKPEIRIGENCYISPHAHVGCDGLNANRHGETQVHTPHIGGVVLEDDVRVGSFATIERAVMGDTIVGKGTHIDHCVVIGHGCKVGPRCAIASNVVVCGSCAIGADVRIGAGALIREGTHIGDGAFIALGAVVVKDVPAGAMVKGNPAREFEGKKPW